jgi:hypothetical protein
MRIHCHLAGWRLLEDQDQDDDQQDDDQQATADIHGSLHSEFDAITT